ncbi:nitroreductase [Maritimibacter sp. DP1N21-5]|uniref:nitroreductase n=1 Tax=Maritimibacter sp. DP1N21-5 TaxID=2836867 RepID=UPI001C462A63|nr:nitroreductase [Maritimibacter sp. DP1N21-5]MBV7407794.1 nitroreductase [Maritimibacter sp. DP1N21-5]
MTERPVSSALTKRRSIRAFRPDPVDRDIVARLLTAARTAPSGANLQPGRFIALAGAALSDFTERLCAEIEAGRPPVSEYSYFPQPMPPALKERQRAAGYALYESLGVARRDVAGRKAQFLLNYRFFSAPVGIVITIRRDMGKGCFMDLGMSLMALMMAAEDEGLATCGIGALANYGDLAGALLNIPGEELVVCGVALGYPDPDAPVNRVRTARDDLDVFAEFRGF